MNDIIAYVMEHNAVSTLLSAYCSDTYKDGLNLRDDIGDLTQKSKKYLLDNNLIKDTGKYFYYLSFLHNERRSEICIVTEKGREIQSIVSSFMRL